MHGFVLGWSALTNSFLDPLPVLNNQIYDFEHIRVNMAVDCFGIPARSASK